MRLWHIGWYEVVNTWWHPLTEDAELHWLSQQCTFPSKNKKEICPPPIFKLEGLADLMMKSVSKASNTPFQECRLG